MREFVTGATGLLGGNLVEALLQDGYRVTALVRSAAKAEHLAAMGVDLVAGDMARVDKFAATLRDELAWFGRHRPQLVGPAAGTLAALAAG